jgi:hypothetical protein
MATANVAAGVQTPAGAGSGVIVLRRLVESCSRAYVVAITNHRVVPTMTVTAAGFAFLLDVRDFPAGREFAIPADNATTGESGEAKKPNETHKTLMRTG